MGTKNNYIKVEYRGDGSDNHILPLHLVGFNADQTALIAE